jgi:phospholipase C
MALNDIQHFFVLMMENRSFDHMLGNSGITGKDAATGIPTKVNGLSSESLAAPFVIQPDPPHEFDNVLMQLSGIGAKMKPFPNNQYPPISQTPIDSQGFLDSYKTAPKPSGDVNDPIYYPDGPPPPFDPKAVLRSFSPTTLPILTTLAKQFAVCDNWFSSIPGPTWPNRFFLHAATSGGVVASPHSICKFKNGTIFDKLDQKSISWKVYHHGIYTQILSIDGMLENLFTNKFREYVKDFQNDINDPSFNTPYIFIEPDQSSNGNSQHPIQDVRNGELLIKDVYEKISKSPLWKSSALIIVYDEHGGFYDHVQPPSAISPGDDKSNAQINNTSNEKNFGYDRLGLRVPAVIISPYIPANTIDHKLYDHTSVISTLNKRFNLGPLGQALLSNRDKFANTFDGLFSLTLPREDIPNFDRVTITPVLNSIAGNSPIGDTLQNYLQLAYQLDLKSTPDPFAQKSITNQVSNINTTQDAQNYITGVGNKIFNA